MDTTKTTEAIDQEPRRLLGTAAMGIAVAGAANLLPSQLAAATAGLVICFELQAELGDAATTTLSGIVAIRLRHVADLQVPREGIGRVITLESRRVNIAAAPGVRLQMTGIVARR